MLIRDGAWRLFLAGALCGTILTAVVGAAWIWWKPADAWPGTALELNDWRSVRSAEDDVTYDRCLAAGNTVVACDALMRLLARDRAAETVMRKRAAELLAAGFSKREVVEWASKQGFVGSQLSDAVGISLKDLRDGKY